MEERTAELNSVYKSLAAQRAPWETWWDRLRDYVLPRRLNREGEVSLPNRDAMDRMTGYYGCGGMPEAGQRPYVLYYAQP